MKQSSKQPAKALQPRSELGKAVARSLKRSAIAARVEAKRYGTSIHVIENGKLVSLKP